MADALDQSWARIDPAKAAAAGIKLIAGYLSNDPSKNWTAANIRAYHDHGIGVLLNWESDPGRPLLGSKAGAADSTEAVRQARQLQAEVGYAWTPGTAIIYSCDRDVTSGQYPAIDAYYSTTKHVTNSAALVNGAYGEADLIDHLHAVGLTETEWQTLAWSYGRISPEADLYQSSINDVLANASVDLDQIRHPATVGAWWPPGHNPNPTADPQEDDMDTQDKQMLAYVYQQIRAGVAHGQTGFGGTVAANLAATQTVANQVGRVLAELQKITAAGAAK